MFKQRFFSAIVLVPIVLLIILYANGWVLGELLAVVLGLAAYEWMRLIPLPLEKEVKKTERLLWIIIYMLGLFLSVLFCWQYYTRSLWVTVGVWCGLMVCILTYPYSARLWGYRSVVYVLSYCLLSLVYLGLSNIYNHAQGPALVIYLLFLVWATDTGGYLIGKQWGKKRLIPKVSPGKTIVGVLGGAVLLLIVAGFGALWFKPQNLLVWFVMAGIVFVFALFGDLFISMLKRRVKIKDMGTLIPGHGGVLDRIDSLIAVIPFFALSLSLLPELVR